MTKKSLVILDVTEFMKSDFISVDQVCIVLFRGLSGVNTIPFDGRRTVKSFSVQWKW